MQTAIVILMAICADPPALTQDEQRLADAMQRYADKAAKVIEAEIAGEEALPPKTKRVSTLEQQYGGGRRRDAKRIRSLQAMLKKAKASPHEMPKLYLWDLAVGDIGRLAGGLPSSDDPRENRFQVLQVVDDDSMLIQSHGKGYTGNAANVAIRRVQKTAWVSGVSTAGITDDEYIPLSQVFEVKGTKRYQTALGGSSTVFELRPFAIQDTMAFEANLAADKPEAKPTGPIFRTWTDATGKFTIEAKFAGIIAGKVNLLTKDGRKIQLEPERLCEADQEFLEEKAYK